MTVTVKPQQRRSLRLAAVLAGLTIATAGCGSDEPADTGTTASTPATPIAGTSTPTATPSRQGDGCPVDEKTLYTALKANKELVDVIDRSLSGVRNAVCHRGYATAYTVVKDADSLAVAYRYDAGAGTWQALAAGSDAVCTDLVPTAIIPHLPGCVGS
ncbi:hypothetical protein GCM10027280_46750 [Micromonospora polyrhachis]|uniref:Uncharacterized protein n=1 Tax=Micromonospora polyrhachis TaxID=1282883 RepID=A0A7W7WPZ2_9ACTN|nr:hypothetical protein [Micromonospora polyrhachis]MBB4959284.1 hypothetical protein [Micromonospora polyrhachis]